jgi:pilus assembly protein CpaC
MHRTLFRPRALLIGGLLFALLAAARPGPVRAQLPLLNTTAITVPTGTTTRLQMSTKKAIKLVRNSKESVLGVKAVPGDPTRVELTGQDAGITHLELTDVDDKVEAFDVIVQADVEFLRIQLRRLAPTANVDPVPISNNVIILRGTVNHIEDVARVTGAAASAMPGVQILSDLRVAGDQQVQLCVTVAEVSRNQFRAMVFDFLTNSKYGFFGSTVGNSVVEPVAVGQSGSSTSGGILSSALFGQTLGGQPGIPNGVPTNLLFGVLHSRWGFIGFLQALRTEGVVKNLAEPTVTTISGRPASFLVGGEQAVPVPAGLGQIGVQFEEFGTRLNVVPIVLGNGKIRLEVEPEVSTLDAAFGTSIGGTVVPGRKTDRINTTVELEDGQTFVIGGLIQKDVTGTTAKTPVLGDLPFFGVLFRGESYSEDETEMVMLVTPHLVDAQDCNQAPKMLPGDETRRPDDFELFLEGILEAPRGQRQVFEDGRYLAAYKNSPTASMFPCGLNGDGHHGAGCANGGCANGNCGNGAIPSTPPAPIAPAAPLPPGTPEAAKSMPMLSPLPTAAAPPANPAPADDTPVMPPAGSDAVKTPAAPEPPAALPAALPPAPPATPPAAPPAVAPGSAKPLSSGGSLPSDLPPAAPTGGDQPK